MKITIEIEDMREALESWRAYCAKEPELTHGNDGAAYLAGYVESCVNIKLGRENR
jgi:hypothetical protein